MGDALQILGFAGSLRRESFNRALLRAAQELAPADLSISVFDLTPIPSYNGDVEAAGDPEPVTAFKGALRQADGLLIATPEYNYSVPGVLKNAIDWASRPSGNSPLRGKPAMLMGATPGSSGTMRAQLALRQSFCLHANGRHAPAGGAGREEPGQVRRPGPSDRRTHA